MTKKTMGIVSLDLDCTAKGSLKNIVGGTVPDYFALIDPYCRSIFTGEKYITSEMLEQILSLASEEVVERMAPKARLIMPLPFNVDVFPLEDRQKIQDFFSSIHEAGFLLSLCVSDKSKFVENFPSVNQTIVDNILDSSLFSRPEKAIPYMRSSNDKARKEYEILKRAEKHSTFADVTAKENNKELFFSSSYKFPTNNRETNQTLNFIMAIILALSLMVIFCKRSNKRKNRLH